MAFGCETKAHKTKERRPLSAKTETVVEEIVAKFRSSVEAALSRPGREFDDLERRARDIGQLAARMSMQALVDQLGTVTSVPRTEGGTR